MSGTEKIYVYGNWRNDLPAQMGTLYVDRGKGKQVVNMGLHGAMGTAYEED